VTVILDGQQAWQAAAWFAVAIALLDSFDIVLPRGDSIGVSGALVPSGVLLIGAWPTAAAALAGLVFAHLTDRTRSGYKSLASSLAVRGGALGLTTALGFIFAAQGIQTPLLLRAVLLASSYLFFELLFAQVAASRESGRPIGRLLKGNLSRQALMLAAQVSAAALVVTTYADMQAWSLVPVVALLLLMRQSYALLLEMRETYRTTVEILVEAAEGQESRLAGHAERTAHIAREISMRLGLSVSEVERASYSALLHDVYAIAGRFGEEGPSGLGGASTVLEGVDFFSDVVPVLRVCDGSLDANDADDRILLLAMVVSLASDIDASRDSNAALAHSESAVGNVAALIPANLKAKVVAAAIEMGYEIPAVA